MEALAKSAAAALDWIGVRLLVAIGGLSIPFAIVQPMLWRMWFRESPPTTSADAGAVMSLMVTLLTFALAAYGLVTYRSIRRRLESELSRQLEMRLAEGLRPAVRTMLILAAVNANRQSLEAWERYENDLWFRKHSYDPSFQSNETFQALVNEAIANAELALSHIDAVEPTDEPVSSSLRYQTMNSLAYHLATRRSDGDETRASQLLSKLDALMPGETMRQFGVAYSLRQLVDLTRQPIIHEALIINEAILETLAWVQLRFAERAGARNESNSLPEAIGILEALLAPGVYPNESRIQYLAKYSQLFGLHLEPVAETPSTTANEEA